MIISHTDANATIITLLPNQSATWAETRRSVWILCGSMVAIGLFWTWQGFWMVLPFAVLEAALVAFLMYRVCQSTYQRQVITCTPQQVLVQFGSYFPRRSWQLTRPQAYLSVTEPRHPLDPQLLSLVDASNNIELGSFLNRDDKEEALRQFKQAGLHARHFNFDGVRTL